MELTERELRALTDEVDEEHRASLDTFTDRAVDLHRATAELPSRRAATLGAVGTGIAVGAAVLPVVGLVRAGAQQGDGALAAFAQSVELAAVQAYQAAAASGKVTTKAIADAATTFAGHHQEHAAAFGSAAGSAATGKPNPKLLEAVSGQLAGAADEMAIVKIAFDLEQAAASTYLFALGALTSPEALKLTASILPVEAQHAVVLGQVLGLDASTYLPTFETTDAAVDPAKYPLS